MQRIILILILLHLSIGIWSQNKEESGDARPVHSININLLGDASLFSINYERQHLITSTLIISSKLGIGYNQEFTLFGGDAENYFTIPHHITANFGKTKHFFELGIGGTIINGETTQPYILYPIIGYRFLPLESDMINFRIFGLIPFSGEADDVLFSPIGLNLGISF